MIGIYKITNLVNNKSYIGQSIDIDRRFKSHKNYPLENSNYPLYRAFRKYGIDNFSFEVLEECSIKELDEKEIYYIKHYDTYNNGYNQTTGGQGNSNNIIKLSYEDVNIIYDLLLHSSISQKEIAQMFQVGNDTISEINQGKTRINPDLSYPLRVNWKKYYCKDCGKEISRYSIRCVECSNKDRAKGISITRDELKQLIRTTPFTTIGKQYGVSDNAVRKWCDKYNLPRKASEIKGYSDEEWKFV